MRRSTSLRAGALILVAAGAATAVVWTRSDARATVLPASGIARTSLGVFGGGAVKEQPEIDEEAPRVYFNRPYTPEAAATWAALHTKLDMPFQNETALDDVLKYIQEGLKPKDAKPDAPPVIQFYVDPVGLQEAEKTMASPMTINLKGMPIATTLELLLKQIGLRYVVRPDGLVYIGIETMTDRSHEDPSLLVLDEIRKLRAEIAQMKQARMGGMGGGMGGGGTGGGAPGGAGGGFR